MANKQNKKPVQKPVSENKSAARNKASISKTAVPKTKYTLTFKLALLLGIFSLAVYANTLKNRFVLDDDSALTENTIVKKGVSAIPEIMSTPYRRGFFVTSNDLYRPLSLAMLATEYSVFELNPLPYHLANVFIFAGCVMLLFLFLDKLFQRKRTAVAFIAALLFALHPIHTEVVGNIKSGDELLCFFFAFLSLNVFFRYITSGKILFLLLGSVCFFLSLLSKETTITFLAIIALIFFFYRDEERKRSIFITVCVVLVAGIFLAIRFSVLNAYNANGIADIDFADNALAYSGLDISSRIATAVLIMGYYLKLLFIPYPLVSDYGYHTFQFVTFSNPAVLITLGVYVFLGVFAIVRFIKNKKDPYAFAILFYLITMSLFSNIIFLIGSTMGERFLFFSSIGFCLAIALLVEKLAAKATNTDIITILKNKKVLAIIIPVSIVFIFITINRNSNWEDNYTLFSNDIKYSPNSCKLNYFLGLELQKVVAPAEKDTAKQRKIREEGLQYLKKSVAIDSNFANAQSDLGNAYFYLLQYDSAEVHEAHAVRIDPGLDIAVKNLTNVYYFTKKYRQSIDLSKKTIETTPDYASSYSNLGRCYLALGGIDSAIFYLRQGINIAPGYNFSYEVLAHCYKAAGNEDSVKKYVAIIQKVKPGFNL